MLADNPETKTATHMIESVEQQQRGMFGQSIQTSFDRKNGMVILS
jgi:hypothetical protein